MNALGVLGTGGRLQVAMGANTISEKGDGFYCHGPNDEPRASINVDEKDGALFFNDTKGERRACINVNEKSSSLYCCDANGECGSSGPVFYIVKDGDWVEAPK